MAKIIVAGNAVVVTSAHTLEDIKTLEKYNPKALTLFEENEDGKKEPVFAVGSTGGKGAINQFGASFADAAHDGSGLATITECLPAGVGDAKEFVADKYGAAVVRLNKLEEGFEAALEQVKADKAEIEANIQIL